MTGKVKAARHKVCCAMKCLTTIMSNVIHERNTVNIIHKTRDAPADYLSVHLYTKPISANSSIFSRVLCSLDRLILFWQPVTSNYCACRQWK